MSTQVVVQGTVKADGTLELDAQIPLPSGRVQVVVQPIEQPPADDPFWQLMQRIWAGQKARNHLPRSAEQVEAERQASREESEAEIQQAIRIHQESQRVPQRHPDSQEGQT